MPRLLSAIQSYGLAVLALSVALVGALLEERMRACRLPFLTLVLAALGINCFFHRVVSHSLRYAF